MIINVFVDRAEAIKASKTRWGVVPVTVDDAFLASLTPEERAELAMENADVFERGRDRTLGDRPIIGVDPVVKPFEATPDVVRTILAARVALRAKLVAEEAIEKAKKEAERAELHAKLLALPAENSIQRGSWSWITSADADRAGGEVLARAREECKRLNAVADAENTARAVATRQAQLEKDAEEKRAAAEFSAALTEWIGKKGTTNQIGRRAENLMPDDEILVLVRNEVFEPLDVFPRFEKLDNEDVECESEGAEEGVPRFETREADIALSDDEFQHLVDIRAELPEGAGAVPRMHRGWCACRFDDCHFEIHKLSTLVTIEWHGRKLSREYAL